jgi:D-threonate/D-erythronate kinase
MMRLLILADDLSGAADCAAACASAGLKTIVALKDIADSIHADVVSFDANTRVMAPLQAAGEIARLIRKYAGDDVFLFKKIDSTLRGNISAELQAALETYRGIYSGRAIAVIAPAFPASGRTTINGVQMLHDQPLHQSDLWRLHAISGSSHIPEMLHHSGLRSETLPLEVIRSTTGLEDTMRSAASGTDLLICDAQTDADLQAIAQASMKLGQRVIWVGSAGLASHLPHAFGLVPAAAVELSALPTLSGPLLFIIGSLSRKSIEQAQHLTTSSGMLRLAVPTAVLLSGTASPQWHEYTQQLERAINAGHDVILGPESDPQIEMSQRPRLSAALARMTASVSGKIGALVASGGETARMVLDRWGITQLRLIGEVEKGVPVSIAENWTRPLPVITKAGDFGTPETLLDCRRFFRSGGHFIGHPIYMDESSL